MRATHRQSDVKRIQTARKNGMEEYGPKDVAELTLQRSPTKQVANTRSWRVVSGRRRER